MTCLLYAAGTDADEAHCAGSLLLELCRISQELEMVHLEKLSVDAFCRVCHVSFSVDVDMMIAHGQNEQDMIDMAQKIATEHRNSYLGKVLQVCDEWALHGMHDAVTFLLKHGTPMQSAPLIGDLRRSLPMAGDYKEAVVDSTICVTNIPV